jgi:hypothetical protein
MLLGYAQEYYFHLRAYPGLNALWTAVNFGRSPQEQRSLSAGVVIWQLGWLGLGRGDGAVNKRLNSIESNPRPECKAAFSPLHDEYMM